LSPDILLFERITSVIGCYVDRQNPFVVTDSSSVGKALGFHRFRLSLNFKGGYIVVVGFRSFLAVIEIVGRHSDVNAPAVAAATLILRQQLS
jgi:hypothetical protein